MRALVLALLVATAGAAQPTSPAAAVRAMEEAVAAFDYEAAEARARDALARGEALTLDQAVDVHSTLGVLLHRRGAEAEARQQFLTALRLDPGLDLDPRFASPVTIDFFETIRTDVASTAGPVAPGEIRYVVLEDPRPAAALRSLAFPGWGQLYKGDVTKGRAFVAAGALVGGGAVASTIGYAVADARYDDATSPAEADRLYGPKNTWFKARNSLLLGSAVVWAAATLDALTAGGPDAPAASRPAPLTVEPAPGGVLLRARF